MVGRGAREIARCCDLPAGTRGEEHRGGSRPRCGHDPEWERLFVSRRDLTIAQTT